MVIPEFGNASPQLGHIQQRLSVLRSEKITIRGKFCHGSVLVLNSSMVRVPAHKAGDLGKPRSRIECFSLNCKIYEGYFFFKVWSVTKLEPQWESDEGFAQMCCTISLVCLSIVTHHTCQFWVRSEPVNMPKTIESPTKCGLRAIIWFLYSEKEWRGMLSSGTVLLHDSVWLHIPAATKRLLKRFRWEVFDHPPSSAWTSLPVFFISFLVWKHRRLASMMRVLDSTTLRKVYTSERQLCREVAGKCG